MGTKETDNLTKVKVAKITATQAVIVALITTIGGALVGFFLSTEKNFLHASSIKVEPIQYWLHSS